jgi:NAD(P)-dependent dehydrogenase (short-subunit alcohol dehydrogenase family)
MAGKVVVITGANNGIGLGLFRALAERGWRVVGLDLSVENLPTERSFVCDVTDPRQVERVIKQTVETWGRIDVLVNNACLAVFSPFEEKPLADTRREFEVNTFGYIRMIKAVLPVMKSQGGGAIHNVSSTVGISGFAGIYGYASTKGALDALTRTLAMELEPYGIVVNLVYPPLTRTRSSSPLGIPASFMADPDVVGRKLAEKIGSRRPVVTPGVMESIGVFVTRMMPRLMGRFLSGRAAAARERSRDR